MCPSSRYGLITFFGIRSYGENNGGTITFGRGLAVGILTARRML